VRAAVMERINEPLTEAEVDCDDLRQDEVLVRVTDSGICHSDRGAQLGHQDRQLPIVLGHEVAGVVARTGSHVTHVSVGDHVVGSAAAYCGTCRQCLLGQPQHCLSKGQVRADGTARLTAGGRPVQVMTGLGSFADHMIVSDRALVRVPPEMPLDKAALLGCAVVTGVGAVLHRARVRPGDTVAVVGCGGVGLNAIQAARMAGAAQIFAVDLVPAKLELAKAFGATYVVDASRQDSVETVREVSRGGVDHAFEVIGLPATIEQACQMTGLRGTTTIVGVAPIGSSMSLSPLAMMAGEKRVQGSRLGSANFRLDIPALCQLYLRGQLMLDELISEVIDLSQVNRGLDRLDSGETARSVIHFDHA